ncbi:uncharacterized protein LOC144145915 [Haemaphysalis longicornis]
MPDYTYVQAGCMEVTLELSCCKYPLSYQLRRFWTDNMKPLIKLLEESHRGLRGVISDEAGYPVTNAKLMVKGRYMPFRTSHKGEYWRILLPGRYTLMASSPEHNELEVPVEIIEGQTTVVNITLIRKVRSYYPGAGVNNVNAEKSGPTFANLYSNVKPNLEDDVDTTDNSLSAPNFNNLEPFAQPGKSNVYREKEDPPQSVSDYYHALYEAIRSLSGGQQAHQKPGQHADSSQGARYSDYEDIPAERRSYPFAASSPTGTAAIQRRTSVDDEPEFLEDTQLEDPLNYSSPVTAVRSTTPTPLTLPRGLSPSSEPTAGEQDGVRKHDASLEPIERPDHSQNTPAPSLSGSDFATSGAGTDNGDILEDVEAVTKSRPQPPMSSSGRWVTGGPMEMTLRTDMVQVNGPNRPMKTSLLRMDRNDTSTSRAEQPPRHAEATTMQTTPPPVYRTHMTVTLVNVSADDSLYDDLSAASRGGTPPATHAAAHNTTPTDVNTAVKDTQGGAQTQQTFDGAVTATNGNKETTRHSAVVEQTHIPQVSRTQGSLNVTPASQKVNPQQPYTVSVSQYDTLPPSIFSSDVEQPRTPTSESSHRVPDGKLYSLVSQPTDAEEPKSREPAASLDEVKPTEQVAEKPTQGQPLSAFEYHPPTTLTKPAKPTKKAHADYPSPTSGVEYEPQSVAAPVRTNSGTKSAGVARQPSTNKHVSSPAEFKGDDRRVAAARPIDAGRPGSRDTPRAQNTRPQATLTPTTISEDHRHTPDGKLHGELTPPKPLSPTEIFDRMRQRRLNLTLSRESSRRPATTTTTTDTYSYTWTKIGKGASGTPLSQGDSSAAELEDEPFKRIPKTTRPITSTRRRQENPRAQPNAPASRAGALKTASKHRHRTTAVPHSPLTPIATFDGQTATVAVKSTPRSSPLRTPTAPGVQDVEGLQSTSVPHSDNENTYRTGAAPGSKQPVTARTNAARTRQTFAPQTLRSGHLRRPHIPETQDDSRNKDLSYPATASDHDYVPRTRGNPQDSVSTLRNEESEREKLQRNGHVPPTVTPSVATRPPLSVGAVEPTQSGYPPPTDTSHLPDVPKERPVVYGHVVTTNEPARPATKYPTSAHPVGSGASQEAHPAGPSAFKTADRRLTHPTTESHSNLASANGDAVSSSPGVRPTQPRLTNRPQRPQHVLTDTTHAILDEDQPHSTLTARPVSVIPMVQDTSYSSDQHQASRLRTTQQPRYFQEPYVPPHATGRHRQQPNAAEASRTPTRSSPSSADDAAYTQTSTGTGQFTREEDSSLGPSPSVTPQKDASAPYQPSLPDSELVTPQQGTRRPSPRDYVTVPARPREQLTRPKTLLRVAEPVNEPPAREVTTASVASHAPEQPAQLVLKELTASQVPHKTDKIFKIQGTVTLSTGQEGHTSNVPARTTLTPRPTNAGYFTPAVSQADTVAPRRNNEARHETLPTRRPPRPTQPTPEDLPVYTETSANRRNRPTVTPKFSTSTLQRPHVPVGITPGEDTQTSLSPSSRGAVLNRGDELQYVDHSTQPAPASPRQFHRSNDYVQTTEKAVFSPERKEEQRENTRPPRPKTFVDRSPTVATPKASLIQTPSLATRFPQTVRLVSSDQRSSSQAHLNSGRPKHGHSNTLSAHKFTETTEDQQKPSTLTSTPPQFDAEEQGTLTSRPPQFIPEQAHRTSRPPQFVPEEQDPRTNSPRQFVPEQAPRTSRPSQSAPEEQDSRTSRPPQLVPEQAPRTSRPPQFAPEEQDPRTNRPPQFVPEQAPRTSGPPQFAPEEQDSRTSRPPQLVPKQFSRTSRPPQFVPEEQDPRTGRPPQFVPEHDAQTSRPPQLVEEQTPHTTRPPQFVQEQAPRPTRPPQFAPQEQSPRAGRPPQFVSQEHSPRISRPPEVIPQEESQTPDQKLRNSSPHTFEEPDRVTSAVTQKLPAGTIPNIQPSTTLPNIYTFTTTHDVNRSTLSGSHTRTTENSGRQHSAGGRTPTERPTHTAEGHREAEHRPLTNDQEHRPSGPPVLFEYDPTTRSYVKSSHQLTPAGRNGNTFSIAVAPDRLGNDRTQNPAVQKQPVGMSTPTAPSKGITQSSGLVTKSFTVLQGAYRGHPKPGLTEQGPVHQQVTNQPAHHQQYTVQEELKKYALHGQERHTSHTESTHAPEPVNTPPERALPNGPPIIAKDRPAGPSSEELNSQEMLTRVIASILNDPTLSHGGNDRPNDATPPYTHQRTPGYKSQEGFRGISNQGHAPNEPANVERPRVKIPLPDSVVHLHDRPSTHEHHSAPLIQDAQSNQNRPHPPGGQQPGERESHVPTTSRAPSQIPPLHVPRHPQHAFPESLMADHDSREQNAAPPGSGEHHQFRTTSSVETSTEVPRKETNFPQLPVVGQSDEVTSDARSVGSPPATQYPSDVPSTLGAFQKHAQTADRLSSSHEQKYRESGERNLDIQTTAAPLERQPPANHFVQRERTRTVPPHDAPPPAPSRYVPHDIFTTVTPVPPTMSTLPPSPPPPQQPRHNSQHSSPRPRPTSRPSPPLPASQEDYSVELEKAIESFHRLIEPEHTSTTKGTTTRPQQVNQAPKNHAAQIGIAPGVTTQQSTHASALLQNYFADRLRALQQNTRPHLLQATPINVQFDNSADPMTLFNTNLQPIPLADLNAQFTGTAPVTYGDAGLVLRSRSSRDTPPNCCFNTPNGRFVFKIGKKKK